VYRTIWFRPLFFPAYIAKSASPRSFSIDIRGSRVCTMPMLAPTRITTLPRTTGSLISASTRSATRKAPSATSTESSSTANSSPPSRTTVSSGRTARRMRRGDLAQQRVALCVAERVVHGLEAVEVEQQQCDALAPRGPDHAADPVAEQQPVGQPGQRVVQGLGADGILRARRWAADARTFTAPVTRPVESPRE
jgi:hypothetical protein